ncbi:MAG: HAMP domain-containing histidine kinase [Oscillospiraceae bacterium]|nr:HAMP domain-containing histidine kinase [Oscillospiraceae bacterium]
MNYFKSIKFQVWLRLEVLALAMLLFTYVFLIALFPYFYEIMKTYEISEAAVTIRANWYKDDLTDIIDELAISNKMYIRVTSVDYETGIMYSYEKSELGGSGSLTTISKERYMEEVRNSETGVVYKRFRDEREDNKVLMLATYVGDNKSAPAGYIFISNYMQPIGTTMLIFIRQFYFVSVGLLILTLIVSFVFANRISEPIIRISRSARELPKGKFDAEIDKHDFSEIEELALTLDSASKEIAKSDDLRRELTANISHDLRTPLTMIKAYAEMIRDLSGDNPEKREKHLKVIIDETDRLTSLVNDVLDLSKLQAGVAEINPEVFDFGSRLAGVISRFDILKESDGIIITLEQEENILIKADITKLEQVVYNLINNAVTYTGDDNTVIVRLFRKGGGVVRFEVIDHGEGIAPEFLPYIWDRYYKVSERNKTHKRAKMGSGIGLSIVKSVLEQHGFAYGADSVVGQGTTFWFEAPEYTPELEQPAEQKSVRLWKQPEKKH